MIHFIPNTPYTKIAWRLLPLLFLCYVTSYLDRVNIGFAKLHMLNDLQLSETVYGLGAGIFFLGYFIFEIPSNMILYKVGARRWIGRIMISWGLISGAMLFVHTDTTFYMLRFLLGVAEAGFLPGVLLYLTYWFPAERRGKITAMLMSAVCIAGVIGGPLSGWIMHAMPGIYGLTGWQWMFVIEAIPSIVLGVVVMLYLPESVQQVTWLTEAEKCFVTQQITTEAASKLSIHFYDAFSQTKVWYMALVYFCFVMPIYGVGFWMPTMVHAAGIDDILYVGLLSAIPYLVAVVVMILMGKSADYHAERRLHVALPALIGGSAMILSTFYSNNIIIALMALSITTAGMMTVIALFWSLPTLILGGAAAAAGIALINSLGNLAGFLSPYLVGWLKDLTLRTDTGMLILAIFLMLGGMLTLRLPAQ